MGRGRKRVQLVPKNGTEQFEVRVACYFVESGATHVAVDISEPDSPVSRPPLHEVLGALRLAEAILLDLYDDRDEK